MMVHDDNMPAFQLGYLDGAFDQAHWMGEEKSHDWGGEAWGEYHDYNAGYWDGWMNTQPLSGEYINDSRSWHEWLREDDILPDGELPSDMHDVMSAFTEYEATIAELRRQLREQQTRPPRYTHRNGEKEPPNIEGWYWVVDVEDGNYMPYTTILWWSNLFNSWRTEDNDDVTEKSTIYGPIPQPITKETNP